MKIEYFDSIWDAIEPSAAEAANMKARADLMISIEETVKRWHATQAASAKRLGLTQPRLNDLLRPWHLTFPRYEALMLLFYSRNGSLPLGKIGERLQVHRTSITSLSCGPRRIPFRIE